LVTIDFDEYLGSYTKKGTVLICNRSHAKAVEAKARVCAKASADIEQSRIFESYKMVCIRVARWFVFKPKMPIWVNFGGSCNEKSWYIL
jgi:hypothetical protein